MKHKAAILHAISHFSIVSSTPWTKKKKKKVSSQTRPTYCLSIDRHDFPSDYARIFIKFLRSVTAILQRVLREVERKWNPAESPLNVVEEGKRKQRRQEGRRISLIKIVTFVHTEACIELAVLPSLLPGKSDWIMTMHKDAQRISYKW